MCPGSVEAPAAGKSVCVMDAAGPLGHALVDRLLRRGYTVHAATYGRGEEDDEGDGEPAAGALRKHLSRGGGGDAYGHRLKVFRADPFDYHAIADAVRGCAGVFCMFNTPDDQAQCDEVTVEEEVRAAHNVLEACAQTDAMERVVFTSSVTAVVWNGDADKEEEHLAVDERCWSDLAFCRKFKLWHALAKTLSEKTAWALAMDRGVDMVAINAGLLTAPGLTAAHPYLKGAPDMYGGGVLATVDVDFLADAHVAAYECPTAYGRYLCFDNAVCRPEDAVKLAQMLSPAAPRSPPSDELKVISQRIQNKKLNKLMLEFASGVYGELD
ncbi:cinnamoyl-CoA reductase 1-like [Panicum miliaceum]|uniref:Cinnamoyl-CoA reductase 1-like n=1 Tax=Panicum miliaceum TaxID=4540 RepID=A0A3L6SBK5_PANMI|nr:cinnamoyl-CoA reductase 1-like [Panicum miliaceum]